MGRVTALYAIVADPLLADTAILYYDFPYGEFRRINADDPWAGAPKTGNLAQYSNDYSRLVRRLVKSDDYCMPAFASMFTDVEAQHGNIRYICASDGFTLRDLVSYNEKHNERNGEDNRDGEQENFSWNCGEEGETGNEEVLRLRRRQARNFLTILFLTQGTPLLSMGDERWNTRRGNNNPYCCDDMDGWMNWGPEEGAEQMLRFVRCLSEFRASHPVFRMRVPFKGTDARSCGYPDLSLHGEEAWRPEISNFTHTLGWLLREDLPADAAGGNKEPRLFYIGINTHWEPRRLALPRPPKGTAWDIVIDTDDERGFLPGINILRGTEIVLAPRSVAVLKLTGIRVRETAPKRLWSDRAPFLNGRKTHIDKRQLSPRIKERLFRLR
jgi:glycogen operon protein